MPEARVAVVTGGNRGIGLEICRQLAARGLKVILTARDEKKARTASEELDGITYVRCGNRRAAICPSCSAEYKGDAWHTVRAHQGVAT